MRHDLTLPRALGPLIICFMTWICGDNKLYKMITIKTGSIYKSQDFVRCNSEENLLGQQFLRNQTGLSYYIGKSLGLTYKLVFSEK